MHFKCDPLAFGRSGPRNGIKNSSSAMLPYVKHTLPYFDTSSIYADSLLYGDIPICDFLKEVSIGDKIRENSEHMF